jgi:hypothetical protein
MLGSTQSRKSIMHQHIEVLMTFIYLQPEAEALMRQQA